MDVLQIIKQDHTKITHDLRALSEVSALKKRQEAVKSVHDELLLHLHIEETYIFPEANGLFPEAEAFVAVALANHTLIRKGLKKLTKLADQPLLKQAEYPKVVEALAATTEQHFAVEESVLMPQMRKLIRTQDREDLGVVIEDIKAEGFEIKELSPSKTKRRA